MTIAYPAKYVYFVGWGKQGTGKTRVPLVIRNRGRGLTETIQHCLALNHFVGKRFIRWKFVVFQITTFNEFLAYCRSSKTEALGNIGHGEPNNFCCWRRYLNSGRFWSSSETFHNEDTCFFGMRHEHGPVPIPQRNR